MLKKRSDALAKKERYAAQLEREEELAERSKRDLEAKQKALQSKIEKGEPAKFDQNELKETNDKLIEFNKQRDVLMELVSLAKKVPELRRSFDTVKGEIQRLEKSIEENRIDPVEIEILETTMGELDRTRISLRKRSDDLYESILALTKKKEGFDAEIVAVDKDIGTLENTIRKLADMEKDLSYSTKLHELMMDFKLHLVARIIPMLSDIASTLLSQLTEGRYSSLTLDDGYNIYIEDGGERYILERFSGGESDLANLCLRLAISRVIAERTGTEGIDLLVLDEIFGSQDASRKRNLMTSFNALSKQFRQIFLITHIDDIREYFSSVIEVYQDEKGTSHARLV
jgi:exonuclease SbcC